MSRAAIHSCERPRAPLLNFSILNDTFEDDMDRSHSDYIELSLQLQFNSRTRE